MRRDGGEDRFYALREQAISDDVVTVAQVFGLCDRRASKVLEIDAVLASQGVVSRDREAEGKRKQTRADDVGPRRASRDDGRVHHAFLKGGEARSARTVGPAEPYAWVLSVEGREVARAYRVSPVRRISHCEHRDAFFRLR